MIIAYHDISSHLITPMIICLKEYYITFFFNIFFFHLLLFLPFFFLEAQALGFAEADPTADVEGHDVQAKICILTKLAYG